MTTLKVWKYFCQLSFRKLYKISDSVSVLNKYGMAPCEPEEIDVCHNKTERDYKEGREFFYFYLFQFFNQYQPNEKKITN